VPFGVLVETGLIAPGTILTDAKRRWEARVCADGSIERDGEQGSIHRIGAAAQNLSACNGWAFWHFERDGALMPIDVLRQQHVLILD
jgi:modification methylase